MECIFLKIYAKKKLIQKNYVKKCGKVELRKIKVQLQNKDVRFVYRGPAPPRAPPLTHVLFRV